MENKTQITDEAAISSNGMLVAGLSLAELLERLPNNLMLARNSYAPEHDRWRLFNTVTNETAEVSGSPTAEECMRKYLEYEEAERKKWVG